MEKNRFCIVHYENKEPYSKLKDVNELNEFRIREAKEKREKLSGETFHEKQCLLVPDGIKNKIHGVHIAPCYKIFTLILFKKRRSTNNNNKIFKTHFIGRNSYT